MTFFLIGPDPTVLSPAVLAAGMVAFLLGAVVVRYMGGRRGQD